MGAVELIAWSIYLLGAVVFGVLTAISNAGVRYVMGEPPSAFWTGALWPIALALSLLLWWLDPMRKEPRRKPAALSPESER